MTDLWSGAPPQKTAVERQVARALRDRLQKLFDYWSFIPASGAPGQGRGTPPTITVRLHEEVRNEALLTLEFDVEGQRPLVLNEVLWTPNQFPQVALFGPSTAEARLPDLISKKFLEMARNLDAIDQRLRDSVPLAEGGRWRRVRSDLSPAIVLPLRYDRYSDLRESEFRLVCEMNRSITRMIVVGTGAKESYTFSEGPKDALVASPVTAGRLELSRLSPRFVYLNEIRTPSPLMSGNPAELDH